MKSLIILWILLITSTGIIIAQNANRKGYVIEAGIGGVVGETPRQKISTKGISHVLEIKGASSPAFYIGIGRRLPIINYNWAYECKFDMQSSFDNLGASLVIRLLPLGFRYTSKEFQDNNSMFVHFNLGCEYNNNNGRDKRFVESSVKNVDPPVEYSDGKGLVGLAYSLGMGINVTSRFSVEACLNCQTIFNACGKNGIGNLIGGFLGVVGGYRF